LGDAPLCILEINGEQRAPPVSCISARSRRSAFALRRTTKLEEEREVVPVPPEEELLAGDEMGLCSRFTLAEPFSAISGT
jgi:hypothetical protein